MSVVEVLEQLGGVADAATLHRATSRRKLRTALHTGVVVRDARDRYALPTAADALRAAHRLSGVATHRSAAAHWGWEMKWQPKLATVTVPRKRKVPKARRRDVKVVWADLREDEVAGPEFTTRERTVVDCMRHLALDEALAIADSALRHRDVTKAQLLALTAGLSGKGSRQARRVAAEASVEAANPFESVLRALALDVPGLDVEPQVVLRLDGVTVRPDLLDRSLGVVLEAESFEWHGDRLALDRDCVRLNLLALDGWLILRFSWEAVMRRPWYVRQTLPAVVAARQGPARQANRAESARKSA